MTIHEQIEVMKHFADGGEVEVSVKHKDGWKITTDPFWNWMGFTYRIKEEPKQKEVFEWYYKTKDNRLFIQTQLLTEYEAKCYFGKIKYFKTGRSFIVEN